MEGHERVSPKLSKFRPSSTLELKTMVENRRSMGLPVFDFGLGETKGELDPAIRQAGERAFREQQTMYTDPAGLPELRNAALRWLNLCEHYDARNVVISTGAKQSLFNIFLAICNPSDSVMLDAAPWVSYQPIVVATYGFPVMVLPLGTQRERLKVTPADLERNLKARPHAKAFLLNNPCNPTGQLYSGDEVNALLDVCVKYRIFFVLDRLYWRIVFDGARFPEPRIDEKTRPWLIQVDGMSKNFRRTGGLRIGWLVAPEDVATAIVKLQSHYTAGPATPTQCAALAAVSQPYDDSMVAELQTNRDHLREHIEGIPHLKAWDTPATFYSFWDVRDCFGRTTPDGAKLRNSEEVAEYLIRSVGVVTCPGSSFMQDEFLRVSFAVPKDELIGGISATRSALSALT